jgi:hypothetical protein
MAVAPRFVALAGLLALVPVAAYAIGKPDYTVLVAALNVVLIAAALWMATGPAQADGQAH